MSRNKTSRCLPLLIGSARGAGRDNYYARPQPRDGRVVVEEDHVGPSGHDIAEDRCVGPGRGRGGRRRGTTPTASAD